MRWGLIPYWAKDIKIGFSAGTGELGVLMGSRLGMIPGIYDAVIDAIDGALRLGKQGGDLDPWIVAEAAARFRKLQSATIPTADAPAAPPSSADR